MERVAAGLEAMIEIRQLRKSYVDRRTKEAVVALDGIDLDIGEGEFVCVVGPSGCGKSTLLGVLAGFESPSGGSARVRPARPGASGPAVVFQEHALFPWRSVLDNVAFGPEMRGVPKRDRHEAARRYLELVRLTGFENKYPHQLSGGMKQRVGLARALSNEPDVLLMDEPFASLDAQTKLLLQQEIIRIWRMTRKTVVYITHAIDEAVLLGQRVVVMTRRPGRIKAIIEIDVGTERTERNLYRYREEIWNLLREEITEL